MSSDNIWPMLLEDLPTEIFLQVFTFFSLGDLFKAFCGLNSHIDSVIRLVRGASHVVKYNDVEAINLLQLFSTNISHLVVINVEMVDFTSLINLRSLTLKYGTEKQYNSIHPQYFPMLEILYIRGFHRTVAMNNNEAIRNNLLQVLLSNGFPQLRIFKAFDIRCDLVFSDTWTGSSTLHTLNLCVSRNFFIKDLTPEELMRSICPRLRQLTTNQFPMDGFEVVADGVNRRIYREIRKLERLEYENKIIIDVNPLRSIGNEQVPPRFNNTTIIERLDATNRFTFQARILPQTEPYCQASFLIEIAFPPEHPFKMPKIIFLDPIYHPNVYDDSGTLSSSGELSDDYGWYKLTTSLVEIIEKVLHFIDNIPGQSEYVNEECFKEYKKDYPTFYKKALERTLSFGRPRY